MSGHETHEARLAELLAADGDALARLAASPQADCPRCRAWLERHAALARDLEALGREERDDRARDTAAPRGTPGAAEAALRARILADTRPRASAARRGWLAAAVALATTALLWWTAARRTAPVPWLGDDPELVHPLEEVEAFTPFTWRGGEVGPSVWYQVVVTPSGSRETFESGPLHEPRWDPDPQDVQRWGDAIEWRLEVYRGTGAGDLAASVPGSARLSR